MIIIIRIGLILFNDFNCLFNYFVKLFLEIFFVNVKLLLNKINIF